MASTPPNQNLGDHDNRGASIPRREFLKRSAATVGAVGALGDVAEAAQSREMPTRTRRARGRGESRTYNVEYTGAYLNQVAFPLGGIGAGMICLEGTGALSHDSLRNRPEVFHEPCVFGAIAIQGKPALARVLEGPVPARKLFGSPGAANGAGGATYGLPRFAGAVFKARFPFATITLSDDTLPLRVALTGWSPFEPGDADNSSLPVAALEDRFTNHGKEAVEAVFSFSAKNFMAQDRNAQARRRVA